MTDALHSAGSGPVGTDLDQMCVTTIRTLAMDAVQRANSGHPGTPMAMAPVAYTVWQRFLRFDPADPIWPNRDRFVLTSLYERFSSRGEAEFINQVLSAMRYEFGGHLEKQAKKSEAA